MKTYLFKARLTNFRGSLDLGGFECTSEKEEEARDEIADTLKNMLRLKFAGTRTDKFSIKDKVTKKQLPQLFRK